MLGNTNYFQSDNSRNSGDLARVAPAVAIIVMTFVSWAGVFIVFARAAQNAPSVQTTSVETIYDSLGGR
jgi:hypothetical protein